MSTAITNTTATSGSYAANSMKESIGMNKDDFLKLFIAQLQNQDPLAPQDTNQMLGQLAQLTQVEQAYNTSAALEKLLTAQDNSLAMTSVALIGKEVTSFGNQVNFDGSSPATLAFDLPAATTANTLKITNSAGQVMRIIDLGGLAAGKNAFQWDGMDGQGNQLAAGAYGFSVSGTNLLGSTVQATTYTTGKADGVRFDNGTAYLTIGAVSLPFADVISVKAS
jgi:flagellar basal-body rod modification protein FlgD